MTRRLVLSMVVVLAACRGGGPITDEHAWPEPAKDAIVRPTESGPVKATLTVWPPKPTLGDPIYVMLTVEAQKGVAIDVPFEREVLGGFRVAAFDARHEHGKDGGATEIRTYELEAPSSGRHRLPPLRVEFVDGRAATAGSGSGSGTGTGTETLEILTEEIPLEIGAVNTDKTAADLKPGKGVIDPVLGRQSPWPWILGALALVGVAAAAFAIARSMRARQVVRAQVSAYEAAMAALAALERRGAPGADDADAWFVELSAIVRRYVEGRFRLRAPELTTEEFLQEAQRSVELDQEHRDRLIAFLEQCDRVKFAGWRPAADESLASLGGARAFVTETRLSTHDAGLPIARAA